MAPNNLWDFFSESGKILNAHSRHLHTLSLIFLFPIFFSLFLFHPSSITNHHAQQPHFLFFHLLYSLFALLFSNFGIITITYSVFHFFNDQSVSLQSAIKSITKSFLPLLATTIVSQVIFFSILFLYCLLLLALVTCGAMIFNVTISHSPHHFTVFIAALPLLLVLIYLLVNWTLVPVIVVVESCWGLEPLRRSARLIKGMKGVALSSFFFYQFFGGITLWNCLLIMKNSNSDTWVLVMINWTFVVSQSCLLAVYMLSNIAVNTLLYIYCKGNNHGEIVEEFVKDGVSLPFHDGKVSISV